MRPDEVEGACAAVSGEVLAEVGTEGPDDSAGCAWTGGRNDANSLLVTVEAHEPTTRRDGATAASDALQQEREASLETEVREVAVGDEASLATTIAGIDGLGFTPAGPRALLTVRSANVTVTVSGSSQHVGQTQLEALVGRAATDVLDHLGLASDVPSAPDDGPVTQIDAGQVAADPCGEADVVSAIVGTGSGVRQTYGSGARRVACYAASPRDVEDPVELQVTTEVVTPDPWAGLDGAGAAAERIRALRDEFFTLIRGGDAQGIGRPWAQAVLLRSEPADLLLLAREDNVLVTIRHSWRGYATPPEERRAESRVLRLARRILADA